MTARPIRYQRQVSDRKGKIFYTSITSLSHISKLTGLIGAVVIMRPSKSVQDLEVKSVKKKYKSNGFAAGCSRVVIQRGADMLGWSLEDLIQQTIDALKTFRP